jgi:acetyl esterase/lipase
MLRLASLLALASALCACSPAGVLNALVPEDAYDLARDVPYGPDPREKLDVYRPRAPAPAAGYPVVVFLYGGAWNRGDRADYKFVGAALASRGIVAVLADYRLYPQVRYPEFLRDCARALAWARREARSHGGDPARLYVMGHSAGGYNAAMLALDPRWLAAEGLAPAMLAGWIGLAGPYDFLPIVNPDAKPVFNHPDYPPGSQPIAYASAASPRAFLGAATSDELVNPERNTKQMAEKLQAAGVPVTLELYSRANHVTLVGAFAWPLRWVAPVLEDVSAFVIEMPKKER